MPDPLETNNPAYRDRMGRLMRAARLRTGVGVEEMATLVSIAAVFPEPLPPDRLAAWESGAGFPMPVSVLMAAMEIAGVQHAGELEGSLPDVATYIELERVLAEARELLDNPEALLRRARRLLGRSVATLALFLDERVAGAVAAVLAAYMAYDDPWRLDVWIAQVTHLAILRHLVP